MEYKDLGKINGIKTYRAICKRCKEDLKHVGSLAQLYCAECKKIIDREKSKLRMRKHRTRKDN